MRKSDSLLENLMPKILRDLEKIDEYLDLARELKKAVKHKGDSDTICIWCTWNSPQSFELEDLDQRKVRDYTDCSIVEISQNIEKSLKTREDLLSLRLQ